MDRAKVQISVNLRFEELNFYRKKLGAIQKNQTGN
jgi:hypothetical protein